MTRSDNASAATIREQAASWLARCRSGRLTADDRRQLDAWLAADTRHRREFEALHALWDAVGDLADSPVVRSERRDASARRAVPWRPALAAAFVLVVAIGLVTLESPMRTLRLTTASGERKQIVLDDGSRLHLDVDSVVTVHPSDNSQHIVVERGEAYFEVVHRPERRFVVEAGAGRIVDIGTRFGVRLEDDGRTTVAVAEGEVEAGLREGDSPPHRVTAGQGVVLGPQTVSQPMPLDADATFAWREGRLVFDRTPLRVAVVRANRYRKEPLAIADTALEGLKVSGVFRLDDNRGLVWALEQTLPLRAVGRDGRVDLVAIRPGGKETPLSPLR